MLFRSQQLQEALEKINGWEFDILHLEKVCEGARRFGPLYYVGTKIFKDFNMCDTLGVDETVITSWMKVRGQDRQTYSQLVNGRSC